jgi:hypothetical protein
MKYNYDYLISQIEYIRDSEIPELKRISIKTDGTGKELWDYQDTVMSDWRKVFNVIVKENPQVFTRNDVDFANAISLFQSTVLRPFPDPELGKTTSIKVLNTIIENIKAVKNAEAEAEKKPETTIPQPANGKKFPIGWVLGGIAVLGILYFMFGKKK